MFNNFHTNIVSLLCSLLLLYPQVAEAAPPQQGVDALRTILDQVIEGQSLQSNWCKEWKILAKNLFSPRSYRVLGKPHEDKEFNGVYGNEIKVRIESSNQAGMPIVKDWYFTIQYRERAMGEIGWCIVDII